MGGRVEQEAASTAAAHHLPRLADGLVPVAHQHCGRQQLVQRVAVHDLLTGRARAVGRIVAEEELEQPGEVVSRGPQAPARREPRAGRARRGGARLAEVDRLRALGVVVACGNVVGGDGGCGVEGGVGHAEGREDPLGEQGLVRQAATASDLSGGVGEGAAEQRDA